MFDFLLLWRCITGPQLFRIYQRHSSSVRCYYPNSLEVWATTVASWVHVGMIISLTLTTMYLLLNLLLVGYCSDILITFVVPNIIPLYVGLIAHVLKGIGRMNNLKYVSFNWFFNIKDVNRLRFYDFDFKFWPVSFHLKENLCTNENNEVGQNNPYEINLNLHTFSMWAWLTDKCGYLFANTCATTFIYPGSKLNWYRKNAIEAGRDTLILKYSGMRTKLCTVEGNHIDTMHIDRRTQYMSRSGQILVICCEGRDSYYETGIMYTPICAGYSVLGWNAPGFANSTGRPYPRQIKNAIAVVVQYAIKVLKFRETNIVLFGGNIGTYAAAWGGVMFPKILSLVLDTPFYDIIKLFPKKPLSQQVVCKYFNLNIYDILVKYNGPVYIIRRVYDEVMSMKNGLRLRANRSNYVFFHLIETRKQQFHIYYYSYTLLKSLSLDQQDRVKIEGIPPNRQAQECLNLVSTYMSDFKISHTAPLPTELLIRAIEASGRGRTYAPGCHSIMPNI